MKYFQGKISHGFVALYSGRMVVRVSSALLSMFIPIFLYSVFDFNFEYVVYYYLIGYLLYGLLVSLGAQFLNKIGLRRSLLISIFFGALFYVFFYLADQKFGQGDTFATEPNFFLITLILSILSVLIYRLMHWLPYHTDLAKFTSKKDRAKELSMQEATSVFLNALLPLFSGFILMRYNYSILFIISIVIYFTSLIPFSAIPRTKERFSWNYFQTWKEFFSKKRRRVVLAYLGDGAESVIGLVVWPIFIWELLEGNYFEVGALSSLIVFATIAVQLVCGRFTDKFDKNKMMRYGNILYATGWLVKIFVATAFQIFITSTYQNFARVFARTPFDAMTYEKAADQGHFVDEFTVIHEMAIQFGRVFMLVFVLILYPFIGMNWTFALAALASLVMNFLADDEAIEKGRHAG